MASAILTREAGRSKPVLWDSPRDGVGREAGGGFRMGRHVQQWLIHVDAGQKPPQYCKVLHLQLKKILICKKEKS